MKNIKLFLITLSLILNQHSAAGNSQYPSVNDSLKVIEKVYLHVDRDSYMAGDDIWFKAYLVDAMDHMLTDHSSNLHVELISPSSKIVSCRSVRLEGGLGYGDFKLSESMGSGRYHLRAYTNYMRNFSDQLFFIKEILVINPNESSEVTERVKYVKNKLQVSFFPEGGSLVDNVSSIVAFKGTNYTGKGEDVSGKIFSSSGELITTFKSRHLGMGTFFLKPLPGLTYYSIVRGDDNTDIRTDLPVSFPQGVVLGASMNQNNELLITVKTNPETLTLISEHDLLLSFSIRKEVFKEMNLKIKSLVTSFVIPTDDLPDGILMLTLSTLKDLPLSERLVYIEREIPPKIQIETNKLSYSKREQVSLRISLSGDSTIEKVGNISLAVVDETFTNKTSQFPTDISSWFLLESDIRGIVEDPAYYFDPANSDRLKDLDLLLRTQGWRDFAWKYQADYFPQENGFKVSGSLRKSSKNKSKDESRVSIGIFGGNIPLLKTVPVDSTGRFKLTGIDLIGEAKLIATGMGKKDHPEGLLTLDSITYNPAKVTDSLFIVSILAENNQSNLKSYYKINEDIRKKYKLSDTINLGEVNIISEKHKDPQTVKIEESRLKYVRPETELLVTEQMLGYNDLLHLLNGKVPGLVVIGDTAISIRGIGSLQFNINPLILIDGNPAKFEDLFRIPVYIVDRIDVLKSIASTNIYGFAGANGVINIITKAGGVPAIYRTPDYSAKQTISGYNAPRIFYSPQHLPDSGSDYIPDLRSTLLWEPYINLDGNKEVTLKYYNGDNVSKVWLIGEGITSTGIPVTGKAGYEVR